MTEKSSPPPAAASQPVTAHLPLPEQAPWDARVNRTRVLFGEGRLADLGRLVRDLGGKRILLIRRKSRYLRKGLLQQLIYWSTLSPLTTSRHLVSQPLSKLLRHEGRRLRREH